MQENIKKERNSNIELLRIISMLLIVLGHFISQSKILNFENIGKFQYIALNYLGNASRIVTCIFIMISAWFMVDAKFKGKSLLKIYGQVAFYTIPITLIVVALGLSSSTKDIFRGLMPFLGRPLWFASAYMILLLMSPFLQRIINWEIKDLKRLVMILFLAISVICTLPDPQTSYVLDTCWFMFIYLFIGLIKKGNYVAKISKHKYKFLIIGLLIYSALSICYSVCNIYSDKAIISKVGKVIQLYIQDFKTVPNFICAFSIFVFFISLKSKNNKVVNYIAKTSFDVYIFHQVPVFISVLWHNVCLCDKLQYSRYPILWTILIVIAVYFMASILGIIRRKFLEERFLNSKICVYLSKKIDDFYTH